MPRGGAPARLDELAGLAGTWLGLTDGGPARHTAAVVADRFDRIVWRDTYEQSAGLRELTEELADESDDARYRHHGQTADLLTDVFLAAYQVRPRLRERTEMTPSRLVDHQVITSLTESPEYAELHRETAGDPYAAAMAVLAQAPALRSMLERTRDARRRAERADRAQRDAEDAATAVAEVLRRAADEADEDRPGPPSPPAGHTADPLTTRPAPNPKDRLTSDFEDQHTEPMRYEEKAKLTTARALVPVALLVTSPVLLIAGAPLRRRYLRYVYRDGAPLILDKKQGRISVHWFVVTSPLLEWLCRPTESLARLVSRRG